MSRVVNSATIDALGSDSVRLATLIELNLSSTYYLTDYGSDISYGGSTYIASSHILEVGDASETGSIKVNSMNITFSAVDRTFVSLFLNSNYMNKTMSIKRAVLDVSGNVIGEPISFFDGKITSFDIEDSGTDSIINVECASHWADWEKVKNRKTNSKSQNSYYPDDRGFDYSADSTTGTEIKWGTR